MSDNYSVLDDYLVAGSFRMADLDPQGPWNGSTHSAHFELKLLLEQPDLSGSRS